jgi:hypothetical protein
MPDGAHFDHQRKEMGAMRSTAYYCNSCHQDGLETSQAGIQSPTLGSLAIEFA